MSHGDGIDLVARKDGGSSELLFSSLDPDAPLCLRDRCAWFRPVPRVPHAPLTSRHCVRFVRSLSQCTSILSLCRPCVFPNPHPFRSTCDWDGSHPFASLVPFRHLPSRNFPPPLLPPSPVWTLRRTPYDPVPPLLPPLPVEDLPVLPDLSSACMPSVRLGSEVGRVWRRDACWTNATFHDVASVAFGIRTSTCTCCTRKWTSKQPIHVGTGAGGTEGVALRHARVAMGTMVAAVEPWTDARQTHESNGMGEDVSGATTFLTVRPCLETGDGMNRPTDPTHVLVVHNASSTWRMGTVLRQTSPRTKA